LYAVFREEYIGNFRFVESRDFKLTKPSIMLLALPDAGLVGVIAASYMISRMGFEDVGGVDSSYIFPVVVVQGGAPKLPIRLFASDRALVLYTELALPVDVSSGLAAATIDYARLRGVDIIIGLTGLPAPNRMDLDEPATYFVASSDELGKMLQSSGVKTMERGLLAGPYAVLIKEASKKRIPAAVILAESFMEFPDPEAAAKALQVLSRLFNLQLDVTGLLEQAELIRLKAREHAKALAQAAQVRRGLEYASSPLYM